MAENQILVKFKAVGERRLINAIEQLHLAQIKLEKGAKAHERALRKLNKQTGILGTKNKRLAASNGLLANSFATIRSKLLLVSFAMSMGIRQLIRFGKQAAKVESMARAFNTMQGTTRGAASAMKELKAATNGAMSQFDLFQQANNAMILGVSKNSSEMAEMFDMAQRLGDALGRDTKSSVESLITGIGRQSRLMLDNIGIIVDSEKAYKDYAEELGINADSLTDAEKKQAFLNATLDSARQKVKNLPPEVMNAQKKFDAFAASADDASVELGQAFLPLILLVTTAMTKFMDSMDEDRIQELALGIGVAAIAFATLSGKIKKAKDAIVAFNLASKKSAWGLIALAIGYTAVELAEYFEIFRDNEDTTNRFLNSNYLLIESQGAFTRQVQLSIDAVNREINLGIPFIDNKKAINDALKLEISTRQKLFDISIDHLSQMTDKLEEYHSFRVQKQLEADLSILNSERTAINESRLSSRRKKIMLDDIQKAEDKLRKKAHNEGIAIKVKAAIADSAISVGQIAMAASTARQMALVQAMGNPLLAAPLIAAITSQQILNTALTIAQGAMAVGNLNAQKMEQGGLIGGRRHSQGGTMVNAESGEFVMSRNAVDAIGVENLNRMNRSGGGGGVNVTFSGNVLSKDFIEDEAIPQIKEAIRRGADIGIS